MNRFTVVFAAMLIALLSGCASTATFGPTGDEVTDARPLATKSLSIGPVLVADEGFQTISPLGNDKRSQVARDFVQKFQSDLAAAGVALSPSGGEMTMDVVVDYFYDIWSVEGQALRVRLVLKKKGAVVRTLYAQMHWGIIWDTSIFVNHVSGDLVQQLKDNVVLH